MKNVKETENEPIDVQTFLPFGAPLEERPANEPTEAEILRSENADLQSRFKHLVAKRLLTDALLSAGARSPELLSEAVKESLEIGDDGSIQNLEAVVAEMKDKYPDQFGPAMMPSIDAGVGQSSPNRITKEALAKMKPDEIALLDWETVKLVLQQ